MPARKTIFLPNGYYHVFNRGSEKRIIFLSPRDYNNFLKRIKDNAKKYSIDILCYCLMPNHFHFLLKQTSDTSVVLFMNTLQLGYAKFFNTKYERVGPLFQGRFKAKQIETDEYLLHLSAYIHKNPVAKSKGSRKQLQHALRTFAYSSYREYLGLAQTAISRPKFILNYFSKSYQSLSYEAFIEGYTPDYESLAPLILDY